MKNDRVCCIVTSHYHRHYHVQMFFISYITRVGRSFQFLLIKVHIAQVHNLRFAKQTRSSYQFHYNWKSCGALSWRGLLKRKISDCTGTALQHGLKPPFINIKQTSLSLKQRFYIFCYYNNFLVNFGKLCGSFTKQAHVSELLYKWLYY